MQKMTNRESCKKYYKTNRDSLLKKKRDCPRGYNSWKAMKERCNNSNRDDYKSYGGRGITYDKRWECFENFIKDMGVPARGQTIEREDNELGYSKSNCRWASRMTQAQNTRQTRLLSFEGKTQSMSAWSREKRIPISTLCSRLNRSGWSVERALNQ